MCMSPNNATSLWIEADPVSGGQASQVEFPAELSGFFHLPQDPVIRETRARLTILHEGRRFPDRLMIFHHNDVWRFNLLTEQQGIGGYTGNILVFVRIDPTTYDLSIVELRSAEAIRLRNQAQQAGTLGFRTRTDGSPREFGYF